MSNYPGYPPANPGMPGMYPAGAAPGVPGGVPSDMYGGMPPYGMPGMPQGIPGPYPAAGPAPGYPGQPAYYPPQASPYGVAPPPGARLHGQVPQYGYPQLPVQQAPIAAVAHQMANVTHQMATGVQLQIQHPSDEPTLRPAASFNPETDAKSLHTAMKGFGTDEKGITDILSNRSIAQRLQIAIVYKTMYGKDLVSKLKAELRGNFEDVVVALMQTPDVYDAHSLRDAISGMGTKNDTLIEILCSRSNAELFQLKNTYKTLFKKDLEKDVSNDTSGYFKRVMVACLTANRTESNIVDQLQAKKDAEALYKAGPKQWGTDESTFISIFALRSFAHLAYMFEEFKKLASSDIEKVVKAETSGNFQDTFLALVNIARNKHAYFAERLHFSMHGAGTHDRILIRLIVTRCERDLENVKREFQRMYGKSLQAYITSDCSGDYKKILLALVK